MGAGLFGIFLWAGMLAVSPPASPVSPPAVYEVRPDDTDIRTVALNMGIGDGLDDVREVLLFNPQLHNIYKLVPGTVLRIPDSGARPAFPPYTTDYSKWKIIASHTSRFAGSPPYRVQNIITSANAVNNFFDDVRHPFIAPRDALSLNHLLGDISLEKGYTWGQAIAFENGVAIDIPAIGGGICQLPSTIFPAAAKAGLDIVERTNHLYYPYFWWKYADGYGFDATINTPSSPDLVIRNLYDHPVRLFVRADLEAETLTVEVWAPPQLTPFHVEIDGPYYYSPQGDFVPIAEAGWVWWSSRAVVSQKVWLDGGMWDRPFWSSYVRDPHWR